MAKKNLLLCAGQGQNSAYSLLLYVEQGQNSAQNISKVDSKIISSNKKKAKSGPWVIFLLGQKAQSKTAHANNGEQRKKSGSCWMPHLSRFPQIISTSLLTETT